LAKRAKRSECHHDRHPSDEVQDGSDRLSRTWSRWRRTQQGQKGARQQRRCLRRSGTRLRSSAERSPSGHRLLCYKKLTSRLQSSISVSVPTFLTSGFQIISAASRSYPPSRPGLPWACSPAPLALEDVHFLRAQLSEMMSV
jgi:hypothetical protein